MSNKRRGLSPFKRFDVWRRDGFRCTYCGQDAISSAIALQVDHIVAVSHGGSDDMDNLTTACPPCNAKKGPHKPRALNRGYLLTFLMPAWLDSNIRSLARRDGVSRSEMVRRLLAKGLEIEAAQEAREAAS